MDGINLNIVTTNIKEAHEELQKIVQTMAKNANMDETELGIALAHIYHHLNFAWNARFKSDLEYATLSDDDFIQWSRFPEDIKDYGSLGMG